MKNRCIHIGCGCILLAILFVGGVSALSVSISPDWIDEGDTVTIDIRDLVNGSSFALRMESTVDLDSQTTFAFRATNFNLPFSLTDSQVHVRAEPVTRAGLRVEHGGTAKTIERFASNGVVDFVQSLDAINSGSIGEWIVFGTVVEGSQSVDRSLELSGKKQGPDSSTITFGLQGVKEGSAWIYVFVDSAEVCGKQIFVGQPPVAGFTANMTSGLAPLTVQFTDTSTGSPTEWSWWFGDGATSMTQHPIHTYTAAGNYTVSLTATNTAGSNTTIRSGLIRVLPTPSGGAVLLIPSAAVQTGCSLVLPIRIANVTGCAGLSLNLTTDPTNLRIDSITGNSTIPGSNVLPRINSDGLVRIALTNTHLITVTDPTAVIDVAVTAVGPSGTVTTLAGIDALWSNASFMPQQIDVTNGIIWIGLKGDFNNNGVMDIGDVAKVAYMVVGKTPVDLAADFNNNGIVDIGDAAKIAYNYVGKIAAL